MKAPKKKKKGFQQTEINHSSDIDFQNLMFLYTECTEKPYCF